MLRFLAIFLMLCLGMLIPVVASPMRVCLLENLAFVVETHPDGTCCDDCERNDDNQSDCCVDLNALPDSTITDSSVKTPPLAVTNLIPHLEILVRLPSNPTANHLADIAKSDTWPPSAIRALLGVWRL